MSFVLFLEHQGKIFFLIAHWLGLVYEANMTYKATVIKVQGDSVAISCRVVICQNQPEPTLTFNISSWQEIGFIQFVGLFFTLYNRISKRKLIWRHFFHQSHKKVNSPLDQWLIKTLPHFKDVWGVFLTGLPIGSHGKQVWNVTSQ